MKRVYRKHLLEEDMKNMPLFMKILFKEIMIQIEDGSEVAYDRTDPISGGKVYKTPKGFLVHEDWTEAIEDDVLVEDMDFKED